MIDPFTVSLGFSILFIVHCGKRALRAFVASRAHEQRGCAGTGAFCHVHPRPLVTPRLCWETA